MPRHHFICKLCGDEKIVIVSIREDSPDHPDCETCKSRMAKRYSFSAGRVPIEIMSTGSGYHSSERSYKDSVKRMNEDAYNRTGFESDFQPFDPRDPDQTPLT